MFRFAVTLMACLALTGVSIAQDVSSDTQTTPSQTSDQGATTETSPALADEATSVPPELTAVTGVLEIEKGDPTSGGVAYFVFQQRLLEIPRDNALERVRAMAEKIVPVGEDGIISANMAPGNYLLVYDPDAETTGDMSPGPESMASLKRTSREQAKQRIETIKENAQKGPAIEDGMLDTAFVVENRIVRPPVTDFGTMVLGEDDTITLSAVNEDGEPINFPAILRLRGKSGDIFEPHNPTADEPGIYTFFDVFPQSYEVIALAAKPRPGQGEEATTPTLKNKQLLFEGEPVEHEVTVIPGKPGQKQDDTPPPPAPAKQE